MNKRGFIKNWIVGLLLFSLMIVGFYLVPIENTNMWNEYGYNATSNLGQYAIQNNLSVNLQAVKCDINPEGDSNCEQENTNLITGAAEAVGNFIDSMVRRGYSATITLFNSFGLAESVLNLAALEIGVSPAISTIIIDIILTVLLMTIIFIIFNRSDSA